jgi:hypothetical protein
MQKEERFVLKPADPSAPLPPVLAIKQVNLKLLDTAEKFPVGSRVKLQGLKAQNHFNGHVVVVTGFLSDQGRYKVRPEDPESTLPPTLAIKGDNLALIAPEPERPKMQRSNSFLGYALGWSAEEEDEQEQPPPQPQQRRGTMGASQPLTILDQTQKAQPNQPRQGSMARRNSCPRMSMNEPTEISHEIGGKYKLKGLRSVPHFNGQLVFIKCYLGDQGRYQVGPVDPSGPLPVEFAVKPANLVPPDHTGPLNADMNRSKGNMKKSFSQKSLIIPGDLDAVTPDARQTMVSPENIDLNPTQVNPGDKMIIAGLVSRPDWNSTMVLVKNYVEEQGRYEVTPICPTGDMPELMLLKPENLLPVVVEQDPVPKDIEFAPDDVSSMASENRSTKKVPFTIGTEVIIHHSMEPELEGMKFRVSKVFESRMEYLLEPVGPEATEACRGGEVIVAHEDLIEANAKLLPPGHRGVIQDYSASLNGHLVKVVSYNAKRRTYLVQPLGKLARKSAGTAALTLSGRQIAEAPPAAFWTTVNKRGRRMFVPCHATVYNTRSGQNAFTAYISCFPGVDKVAPLARVLLGEDRCNWEDPEEVKTFLSKSGSNSIALEVKDKAARKSIGEDEIVLKPNKHANTIDALVEYELIEKTDRTVEVEGYGVLPIWKLTYDFEISKTSDKSDASPTTVMESSDKPRSKREQLTKTFSCTLLESDKREELDAKSSHS